VTCHRIDSGIEQKIACLERLSEDFAVLLMWLLNYCKEQNIPITSEAKPRLLLNKIMNEVKELNPEIPNSYLTILKYKSDEKKQSNDSDDKVTEPQFWVVTF